MGMATDYDAPRKTDEDTESIQALQERVPDKLSGTRSWMSVEGKAALGQMARSLTRVRPVIISVPRLMGISGLRKR